MESLLTVHIHVLAGEKVMLLEGQGGGGGGGGGRVSFENMYLCAGRREGHAASYLDRIPLRKCSGDGVKICYRAAKVNHAY